MAEINIERRDFLQAVYAQMQRGRKPVLMRGWEKRGVFARLKLTSSEIAEVKRELSTPGSGAFAPAFLAVEGLISPRGPASEVENVAQFAAADLEALALMAAQMMEHRARAVGVALKSLVSLGKAFERAALPGHSKTHDGQRALPPQGGTGHPMTGAAQSIRDLADWALQHDSSAAASLLDLTVKTGLDPATTKPDNLLVAARTYIENGWNEVEVLRTRLVVEPIGFLHLERLTFTPAGIERGELIHSLPMAPGEEVTVAHKEWSNTSEEFQKIVTDYEEAFSEEGVAEKSEMVQATSSQTQHANGFNTGVTASGGYGPVTITASAGYTANSSAILSEQSSRDHSIAVTRKASSRTKKEHKVSFKVASSSGTEDQAVRRIKNPFDDKATRIDYYQLIRKWRVDLYRYGLRLTYDIAIPEPGAGILSKLKELREIQHFLELGFNNPAADPATTPAWARFDLTPGQITRETAATYAVQYGAPAPPLAPQTILIDVVNSRDWQTEDVAKHYQLTNFEVKVPDDYQVDSTNLWGWCGAFLKADDDNLHFDYTNLIETQRWNGRSGTFQYIVGSQGLSSFSVHVQVTASLRDETYHAWQLKTWALLRDTAQARFYEQRQLLKDRVAELTAELGAQDALSLRKVEREEVMKGVLTWLFGPSFAFVPPNFPVDLENSAGSVIDKATWGMVMAKGEIIKFLHHAIEWENVLYFLYPYFWSHPKKWEFKKYLDHPDAMHRVFLKSGSARVVLTIRPGFEEDFVSFFETGSFNSLPVNHPYLTIAKEIEEYAMTNYPGIPPANPEGADTNEKGKLIGTWYEYTPTSAMDIAFNETLPSG